MAQQQGDGKIRGISSHSLTVAETIKLCYYQTQHPFMDGDDVSSLHPRST